MGSVSILLENPKTPFNVGSVIRAASCYEASSVFWTGDRIDRAMAARISKVSNPRKARRLPREERIRDYSDVDFHMVSEEDARAVMANASSVVCIELLGGAQPLTWFEHATRVEDDVVYVFGPEDGTVKKEWRSYCHSFVFIPTRHCINLAAAVYTVLYDRQTKEAARGVFQPLSVKETLGGR